jgi:cytochrome b
MIGSDRKGIQDQIYVWDAFVRSFHWMLVLSVTAAFLTEKGTSLHAGAGYAAGALIAARVVWGFIGSRYARFSEFLYPPSSTLRYVFDLLVLRAGERRIGHSPGGVYVITLLLVCLAGTVISGVLVYGDEQQAKDWHRVFADIALALVCVHIVGVCLRSFVYRENLFLAMLTGFKRK